MDASDEMTQDKMAQAVRTPSDMAQNLLHWYDRYARSLPWRSPPGGPRPDPYRVWLSEVMLQQTTVAAVIPYFETFTTRWPDITALAAAPEAEIMAAWAGLGYYARARNMVACAREVAQRGSFPDHEDGLRALPGLGAYTAAAVAAIAFGRRAVVVDANVERVVARLFAIAEALPAARKEIRRRADQITPTNRAGDFAQAMMDLGAAICTSRDPRCLLCPLAQQCAARAAGDPARFPVKAPKKARPQRTGQAYWIERGGAVWLVRRKGAGMLGGMRALPDDGWSARKDGSADAPCSGLWQCGGSVQHGFTHFALKLDVMILNDENPSSLPEAEGEWWPLDQIAQAGLPTLFAKAVQLAMAMKEAP